MAARRKTSARPDAPTNVIAFQGEFGANSDMACRAAFPYMTTRPCHTFEDAVQAVHARKADLAMIPIENSIAGRVADLHSLLPNAGLWIVGEHFQRVEHCLVAVRGATLKTVKVARSHVQALAQCRGFLRKQRIAAEVHADTAGAAKDIAKLGDPKIAAIASSLAAKIYGLQVLKRNIEDADHNTTRMLVFSREANDTDYRVGGPYLTAFVFQVKSRPAALYKALGGFATNGVNITKLESYLSGAAFEQAQFYAEIEGHKDHPSVQLALEELGFFAEMRLLGTFPAHPFRRKGWEAPTRTGT